MIFLLGYLIARLSHVKIEVISSEELVVLFVFSPEQELVRDRSISGSGPNVSGEYRSRNRLISSLEYHAALPDDSRPTISNKNTKLISIIKINKHDIIAKTFSQ